MRYALIIYMSEDLADHASESEREAVLDEHRALQSDSKARREFVAAVQLMPSTAATSVRRLGEEAAITDGPFLESKELLAGFYLLDCKSLDEAVEYARRIPTYGGAVEVRPVAYEEIAASA